MYLRHTTRRKDGKVHTYWQLVRSVRVGRKVVQQTVAHLGELDVHGRARAQALARAITGDRPQPDLFEPETDEAISVRVKRIRLERGRTFGDVCVVVRNLIGGSGVVAWARRCRRLSVGWTRRIKIARGRSPGAEATDGGHHP